MLPSPVTMDERFSLPCQSLRLEMEIYMDFFNQLKSCGKVVGK